MTTKMDILFLCFEIFKFLVIDKNFCKRGGNVTGMFSYGPPHRGIPTKHPRYGSSPYWELPPPYKL